MTRDHAERLPPHMLQSECEGFDDLCVPADIGGTRPWAAPVLLALDGALARLPGREIGPFDLRVEAGERIAILGPSGAGKSTLLKLMAAERVPHAGRVTLGGRPVAAWPLPALARQRAVLPQSHAVAFGLAVELVVSLGRVAREPDPRQAEIVSDALRLACADGLAGRRFDTLSGGEQARVQLARVFAQLWDAEGGLLLVDEPVSALDPGLQFELMDAMQAFARGRGHALIAVLHDINQAFAAFDRLWLLKHGRLIADVASGRTAVPALEALYGIRLLCVPLAGAGGPGGGAAPVAVVPMRRSRAVLGGR